MILIGFDLTNDDHFPRPERVNDVLGWQAMPMDLSRRWTHIKSTCQHVCYGVRPCRSSIRQMDEILSPVLVHRFATISLVRLIIPKNKKTQVCSKFHFDGSSLSQKRAKERDAEKASQPN